MNLRWITRNGEKVLQQYEQHTPLISEVVTLYNGGYSSFAHTADIKYAWTDVPIETQKSSQGSVLPPGFKPVDKYILAAALNKTNPAEAQRAEYTPLFINLCKELGLE